MKFSKRMCLLLILCAGCQLVLIAQSDHEKALSAKDEATESSSVVAQSPGVTDKGIVDESTLPINSDSPNQNKAEKEPSSGWLFLRMVIVLALVLACIYIVVALMKKGLKPGVENDPFLRKVSSITLSPGKTVQIVSLIDHAYIIGVTDNAVNLIGEVTDKELVDAMNLYADKNAKAAKPRTFNDVLSIFMPNGPKEKSESLFADSAKKASDLLKKQRNRLDNGENL